MPFCRIVLRTKRPLPAAYPKELKTLGNHLRKKRLDLKLRQKDVARIIGTSMASVGYWEMNKFVPLDRFIPKIISFIGYIPPNFLPENLPGKIRAGRKLLGLSQEGLASYLGVDVSTVADWEKHRHEPTRKSLEKLAKLLTSLPSTAGEPTR
ncbi:MAG: helix-turn-helix transcriptional regulator [Candidatus Omnitrophota bacterium]